LAPSRTSVGPVAPFDRGLIGRWSFSSLCVFALPAFFLLVRPRAICSAPTCLCVPALSLVPRPVCTFPHRCVAAGRRSYSDDRARRSQSVMPPGVAASAPSSPARFEGLRAKIVAGVRLAGNGKDTGQETLRQQVLPCLPRCFRMGLGGKPRDDAAG
jgi:hypothetical protein